MRPLPFDLADLRAFVSVVEIGSLTRAAERLGSSKSVLSRRIGSLEYALGSQLLVRDRSGARLTEAGADFHRVAADVLARLEQVRDEAAAGLTELAGPVRITAPLSFGATHLAPALAAFAAANSLVELDVRLDDHVVDLLAGGFDLALRIGQAPDTALNARRLAGVRPHLLASPDYLDRRGRPFAPADLVGHDVVEYTNQGLQPWRAAFGVAVDTASLKVRFRSDNGETLRGAAVAGLGLVILPDFLVEQAVRKGELQPLLCDYRLPEAGLFAIPAPGRPRLRRVRALVDHLARSFGPEPPWAFIG